MIYSVGVQAKSWPQGQKHITWVRYWTGRPVVTMQLCSQHAFDHVFTPVMSRRWTSRRNELELWTSVKLKWVVSSYISVEFCIGGFSTVLSLMTQWLFCVGTDKAWREVTCVRHHLLCSPHCITCFFVVRTFALILSCSALPYEPICKCLIKSFSSVSLLAYFHHKLGDENGITGVRGLLDLSAEHEYCMQLESRALTSIDQQIF